MVYIHACTGQVLTCLPNPCKIVHKQDNKTWVLPFSNLEYPKSTQHVRCLETLTDHQGWVRCINWSPCGNYFLSGSDDHTIKVWLFQHGHVKYLETLTDHQSYVWSLSWSPRGNYFLSTSRDNTIKVWLI